MFWKTHPDLKAKTVNYLNLFITDMTDLKCVKMKMQDNTKAIIFRTRQTLNNNMPVGFDRHTNCMIYFQLV